MKLASKLLMIAALGATALTAIAGSASAQETYAVTKYEYSRANSTDTHGLTFGLSGKYDSGFAYDLSLMSADTKGVGTLGADVELSYTIGGIAGPVALYETRKTGGLETDQFLVGVAGGTSLHGFDLTGKALVDVDEKKNYRLSMGADYAVNKDLVLTGELTHYAYESAPKMNLIEVGARYKLVGNVHADVGAHYGREHGGAEKTGLHLGLGFNF
ncbi:hypothetical protein IQ03_01316 [Gemmobacter caeni]|uniref:Outer membrane protein with beta-barrel domain n=1 Tax=Gemmobacter caeni TaxID=589035 RepID=A0A2T6B8T3_9RHOB|nr:hypothetical protein [Gemmobacter caeni]PTX52432.1 hypothetical protein C8N34_102211 [Gemmobacter caeni]TWJ02897.1 hypothetical protein IQ03_01316 [Gemmobacter caeni]